MEKERAHTSAKAVKPKSPRWVLPSQAPRQKMKRLFMWAILKLHEEGSIVLCDRPLLYISGLASLPIFDIPDSTTTPNRSMFASPDVSHSTFAMPEQDGYLSDPPPYEEDEAYIPVTPALLGGPVREILHAKGITSKSAAVGAEEIIQELKRSDARWGWVRIQAIQEAMETILID
ncbi:hypothetical protein BDR03DRAFT_1009487 [Suillus americanus]|nr:hypothetical protein BDR03DRAFT_1009487 [Suillus americanus]